MYKIVTRATGVARVTEVTRRGFSTYGIGKNSIFSTVRQIFDALNIGAQGIGVVQFVDPLRRLGYLDPVSLPKKEHWNIEARRKFQQALENFVPTTESARKQQQTILHNNAKWDENFHPFAETSIDFFLAQLRLLNDPHLTMNHTDKLIKRLKALEVKIRQCFLSELGAIDGQAANMLHAAIASPAASRFLLLYLFEESHDEQLIRKQEVINEHKHNHKHKHKHKHNDDTDEKPHSRAPRR